MPLPKYSRPPAPLIDEPAAIVLAPLMPNTDPETTSKSPVLLVPVLVCPTHSSPLETVTVPELLKVAPTSVTPAPADLVKVPLLLKLDTAPEVC